MYFLLNRNTQAITAHKSMGAASRAALEMSELELPAATDPVSYAQQALGDSIQIYNLSAAFKTISESYDGDAQELAKSFHQSVNEFFK